MWRRQRSAAPLERRTVEVPETRSPVYLRTVTDHGLNRISPQNTNSCCSAWDPLRSRESTPRGPDVAHISPHFYGHGTRLRQPTRIESRMGWISTAVHAQPSLFFSPPSRKVRQLKFGSVDEPSTIAKSPHAATGDYRPLSYSRDPNRIVELGPACGACVTKSPGWHRGPSSHSSFTGNTPSQAEVNKALKALDFHDLPCTIRSAVLNNHSLGDLDCRVGSPTAPGGGILCALRHEHCGAMTQSPPTTAGLQPLHGRNRRARPEHEDRFQCDPRQVR